MSFQEVGEQFARYYYQQFDKDRSTLSSLYREESMLSFEGQQFKGVTAIVQKLVGLPFGRVEHQVVTCDCQPTTAVSPQGIMVTVSGNLAIDDNQPMKFAQSFLLLPDSTNASNYWVHNDIFRLNLS